MDGQCSITIAGQEIYFGGRSAEVQGRFIGIEFQTHRPEYYCGKEAEVFGRITEFGYSIYGSKDYYIKLIE